MGWKVKRLDLEEKGLSREESGGMPKKKGGLKGKRLYLEEKGLNREEKRGCQ